LDLSQTAGVYDWKKVEGPAHSYVQNEARIERGWLFSCIFGLKDVFSPAQVKCHRKRYN
jgi:hypothetical protein